MNAAKHFTKLSLSFKKDLRFRFEAGQKLDDSRRE